MIPKPNVQIAQHFQTYANTLKQKGHKMSSVHSECNLFVTVNHSPTPQHLVSRRTPSDPPSICLAGKAPTKNHNVNRCLQKRSAGSGNSTTGCLCVCACAHMCMHQGHCGVRAYSVIFQRQNTLFKDCAGPA